MKPPRKRLLIRLRTAPDPTPRLALSLNVYRNLHPGQTLIGLIGEVAALYPIGSEVTLLSHTVKPVDCPLYTAGYTSVIVGDEHDAFRIKKRLRERRRQSDWE
ncbi:hypothetical protein DEI81_08345 [Curtobacterium sp. MCBD17_013]|uniref:hypothetical protein n=1 Tax=Curtobacterium sp. MCBD17_013 TaxID=2175668 RepID=UPI000DA740A1|nr:hypothetical protein [Curtobacterium sp. MCBD17_013]PZF62958.1 hypothetical protein DEI81_08345 [Curtobacterium sp. MCBD17_013]